MSRLFALLACLALTGCPGSKKTAAVPPKYNPAAGDFLFQSLPHDRLIDTIEESSGSPLSHCGIVKQTEGKWVVIEAIGPVKETPLSEWIAQGRDNAFVAYRLRAPLAEKIPAIISAA